MKFHIRLLATLLLIAVGQLCATAASITVADLSGARFSQQTLALGLDNEGIDVVGFQMDIDIPDGLAIAKSADGELAISLDSRAANWQLAVSQLSSTQYRLVGYSSTNATLRNSSGGLVKIELLLDGVTGSYAIPISNILITDKDLQEHELDAAWSTVEILNIAFGSRDIEGSQGSQVTMPISIENPGLDILGLQFDVNFDDASISLLDVTPKNSISNWNVAFNQLSNGTFRIVTYSYDADVLGQCNEDLLSLTLKLDGEVGAHKAEVSALITDGQLREHQLESDFLPNPTVTILSTTVEAESVTLSASALSLLVGETAQLTATVLPENATDKTVTWSSSDTSVATVDQNGVVTAVYVGKAVITATCGSVSATCEVTVDPVPAESVTLNKESLELTLGQSEQLTATILPENTTVKTIVWITTDSSIASVDQNGLVTAVGVGTAWVAATTATATASCEVTVIPLDQCAMPAITYDGRYATIDGDEAYTIYYKLDGGATTIYTGRFDVNAASKIEAWAEMEGFNDSEVAVYEAPAYYDGTTATVHKAGQMRVAFGWVDDTDAITALKIAGTVDSEDAWTLQELDGLRFVDFGDTEVGDGFYFENPHLAAVKWTSRPIMVPDDIHSNPNRLVYVSTADVVNGSDLTNFVIDGTAALIGLEEECDFYCPIAFKAESATYTRTFTMETALDGGTQGWESLTLPFSPTSIRHLGNGQVPAKGEITPFGAISGALGDAKPFWLHSLDGEWQSASRIEAYEPYVISMPNNAIYDENYLLVGDVEFIGENVDFPVTESVTRESGNYRFTGSMVYIEGSNAVAPVNAASAGGQKVNTGGLLEGSAFVPGLREVFPFEAYLANADGSPMNAPVRIADLGSQLGGVLTVMATDQLMRVYSLGSTIFVTVSEAQPAALYSVDGKLLRSIALQPGSNEVRGLAPAIYLLRVGDRTYRMITK